MSPIEPVSPLSPMDVSPVSPSYHVAGDQWPSTPVLSPSVHLPRLVTAFQSSVVDSFRRLSTQFALPTPSPFSLQQTPVTALSHHNLPLAQRSSSISSVSARGSWGSRSIPLSADANPQQSEAEYLPLVSPAVGQRYSQPRRENAMEGLERLSFGVSSPIIEHVLSSPIEKLTQDQTARYRSCVSQEHSQRTAALEREAMPLRQSGRVQPRSPINKHRRWRHRRAMAASSTKIYVRRPLTRQQREYQARVAHLGNELQPLISVRTGQPHLEFPRSLLQYHLLTHAQLDSLARWYHQTIDAGDERWMYPAPIAFGKAWCGSTPLPGGAVKTELVDLGTKRRRWGRFIGLKGCESPVSTAPQESLTDRMEREWREALKKSEDETRLREKLWGRRIG